MTNPAFRTTIRRRTLAAAFIVIAVALGGAGFWYYQVQAKAIHQNSYETVAAISKMKVGQIVQWKKERLIDVTREAHSPTLIRGFGMIARNAETPEIRDQVLEILKLSKKQEEYSNVIVLSPSGKVLFSTGGGPVSIEATTQRAVEAARANPGGVLSDFFRTPEGEVCIDAVATTRDAGGSVLGFIVFRCRAASYLYPLIQSWPTHSRSAETLLVEREGQNVIFLNELRHRSKTALSFRDSLSQTHLPAVQAVLGKRGMFDGKDYRHVEVLADLSSIPGTPWFMVAKVDRDELMAEAHYRAVSTSIIVGAFILLISLASAFVFTWRHAKLLQKLFESERYQREQQIIFSQLAAIIESSEDAIIGKDLNSIITSWNRGAEKIFGYAASEMVGTSIMRLIPEDRKFEEIQILEKIRKGERVEHFETVRQTKDGRLIDVSVTFSPIKDAAGQIVGVSKIVRDITEGKMIQGATSFLASCNLLPGEDFFQALARYLGETLGMDFVCIDRLEGDCLTAQTEAMFVNGKFEDNVTYALKDTPCGDVVGKTVCCFPAGVRHLFPKDAVLQDMAAESYVGVTLWGHTGKPIGLIAIIGNRPLANPQLAESILKLVAVRAAGELERKQAETTLRKSEERFRRYFELPLIGIAITSPTKGWLEVNDRLCEMLGYSRAELLQMTWAELTDPDDLAADMAQFERLRAGEIEGYQTEKRFLRKDGQAIPTNLAVGCVRTETGVLDYAVALLQDNTERNRSEKALKESAMHFHTLADSGQVLVWTSGIDKKCDYVNRVWLDFTGRALEQELGDGWAEGVHPDDLDSCFRTYVEAFDRHEPFSMDYRLRRHDGEYRWLQDDGTARYSTEGEFLGYIGHCLDITDRKQAEEALKESLAVNESILNVIPFGMDIVNKEGRILFRNAVLEQVSGNLAQDQKCWEVYCDNQQQCIKCPLKRPIPIGETHTIEVAGVLGGRIMEITHTGMVYKGEEVILELFYDITERRAMENKLQYSQRMESIGTLAAGVAHDLNNIITPIILSTEMLREAEDSATRECLISSIEACAQRGAAVVNQVLTFARGAKGERSALQLNHLVDDMVKIGCETFPKNLTITSEIPSDLWPINGDSTQIHQVILNLCINARDAMPEGGTLHISAENAEIDENFAAMVPDAKAGDYAMLAVSDTGMGIAREIVLKIFDPFFTTKEVGKGTGLGLSTVAGIVRSHGGFVTVKSEAGLGTTFKVFLPRDMEGTAEQKHLPPTEISQVGGGATILVVDDETVIAKTLSMVLANKGYKVLTAFDGNEAMALYREHANEIDLVLTDVMMPGMDGVALFRALKEINPRVKILASTGQASESRQDELHALGVDHILHKPYDAKKLLKALHDAIHAELAYRENVSAHYPVKGCT
jgi:PAS domain S-box-containing protein